jgi:hypothetical protein
MKTKHTATRRPTRKNKRIMSGGGKISKITRRFKDHFKRFFKINENDKIKKCEAWGSLNGIFKFVEAQNEKYTGADGTELSGLDKMIGNINKTPNSSNKDRYIKAIDCFKKGCDTILSGDKCVSYSDFVNGGGVAAPAPVETPAAVAAVAPLAADAKEETSDSPVAQVDADKGNNAGQSEAVVPAAEAAVQEETSDAPVAASEGEEDTSGDAAAPTVTESDAASEGEEDTSGDAAATATTAALDNNNTKNSSTTTEGPGEEEEDASQSQQPAASVDKSSEGGGRPRRYSRPSRRIKSRKSKKGRMTRRKHRAVRR